MATIRLLLLVLTTILCVTLSCASPPRVLFSLQPSCDPLVLQAAAAAEQTDLKVTPHHLWSLVSNRVEFEGDGWFAPRSSLLPRVLRPHLDGVKRMAYGSYTRVVVLETSSDEGADSVVEELKKWGAGGCLLFASRDNALLTVQSARDAAQGSKDPNLRDQWGLFAIDVMNDRNQHVGGAWASTTGEPNVTVAVIDTGVDLTHPELQKNVWRNTDDKVGDGVDNEGNGFADDLSGFNFVDDNGDVSDKNGHGTHLVGVIAAEGDNDIGIVGVAMDARVMALKAFSQQGTGRLSDVVRALDYAAFMGAQVVVLAAEAAAGNTTGEAGFEALKQALTALSDEGILLVVPAGNDHQDLHGASYYPACWNIDGMIVVGASGGAESIADFSNYGTNHVDLLAPGVSITTTAPGGELTSVSGTSISASFVAGVAALLLSDLAKNKQPYEGYGAWVTQVILSSVDYHQQYVQYVASGGRVNAGKALALQQELLQLGAGDTPGKADGGRVGRWDIDADPQASPVTITLDRSMHQQRGAGPIMRVDAPARTQSTFSLSDSDHYMPEGGDSIQHEQEPQPGAPATTSHFTWLWNSIKDARMAGLFHACDDLRDCGSK